MSIRYLFGVGKSGVSEISQLDRGNSFCYSRVYNKKELLKEIILNVPEGSIWSIEGFQSKEIFKLLEPFIYKDELYSKRSIIFPKGCVMKVQLTEGAKKEIGTHINSWNLDREIIHQRIYRGKDTYLVSYDNLHEACTWISNEMRHKIKNIEELIEIDI